MVPRSTDVTIKSKQVNQNKNKIKQTNKTIKCSECVQQNTKTFLCYHAGMINTQDSCVMIIFCIS